MHKKIILIVDDDQSFIDCLRTVLTSLGKIETANTIAEAEKYIADNKPNIILLDNHLPDGLGIKLLKKLKSRHEMKNIPIILITASSDPDNEEDALNVGANDYMQKPINLKITYLKVRNALRLNAAFSR